MVTAMDVLIRLKNAMSLVRGARSLYLKKCRICSPAPNPCCPRARLKHARVATERAYAYV